MGRSGYVDMRKWSMRIWKLEDMRKWGDGKMSKWEYVEIWIL